MIEFDIEDEDLVYEILLTLKENEETLFRNFSLLTPAIGILFIILRKLFKSEQSDKRDSFKEVEK